MTFLSLVLLVLLAVAIAVIFSLLRRRPAETLPPARPEASPYARDDAFGRPDPAWGRYPPQPAMPPAGGGLGSSVAGGLAAGLAMGAGAVAAQEIGRRMFEHGHEGAAHAADPSPLPSHDQSHSQLARDAGIGAFDPDAHAPGPQGLQDFGEGDWGDAGVVDDGAGWDT